MTPIIDAHLDLAWNALFWDRDLTLPLDQLNRAEAHLTDHRGRGRATVCLPEMRRGDVRVCLATILVRSKTTRPAEGFNRRALDYPNQTHACAIGQAQLAYYRLLSQQHQIKIIETREQLNHYWQQPSIPCIIISMEGADPITEPSQLGWWYAQGLRLIGLAHYGPSAYAVGTGATGPLTPAGVDLLREMSRLKMILDITHTAEESFYHALEVFDGPVLASHNNCRELVPGDRQFADEQIKVLIERGAVIGVACDAWMLYPGWQVGQTDRSVLPLMSMIDQVDHICQIAGSTAHVAIGSDLDGGFGAEQTPTGLDSIADLQKLAPHLEQRGYSPNDITSIFHGNWMRFLTAHLP